jgi:hypothetical protein
MLPIYRNYDREDIMGANGFGFNLEKAVINHGEHGDTAKRLGRAHITHRVTQTYRASSCFSAVSPWC